MRLLVRGEAVEVASLPTHGRYTLGRAPEAQILVRDNTVSRVHAALDCRADGMTLTDLGSANGTAIGLSRLHANESRPVAVGEAFVLGDVLGVVYEGAASLRARCVSGPEGLSSDVERLLGGSAAEPESPFSVATLRGAQVASKLQLVVGLAPPQSTIAATSDNVISVLLPGWSRTASIAWCETLAMHLAPVTGGPGASVVAAEVLSFPEDGFTLEALCPQDDVQSTAPRRRPPLHTGAENDLSSHDMATPLRSALARTEAPSREELTVPPAARAQHAGTIDSLDEEMARIERIKIQDALEKCAGNQTRAAEMLGISRRALIGRLEKHKLARPRR